MIGALLAPLPLLASVSWSAQADAARGLPKVAVSVRDGDLYVGGRRITSGGADSEPDWSPDRRRIVFVRLCELIGRPELAERHLVADAQEELAEELAALFAARSLAQWLELFDGEDVCAGPVARLAEAAVEFGDATAPPSVAVGQHTRAWREELGLA